MSQQAVLPLGFVSRFGVREGVEQAHGVSEALPLSGTQGLDVHPASPGQALGFVGGSCETCPRAVAAPLCQRCRRVRHCCAAPPPLPGDISTGTWRQPVLTLVLFPELSRLHLFSSLVQKGVTLLARPLVSSEPTWPRLGDRPRALWVT